jgi:hypothetical protein
MKLSEIIEKDKPCCLSHPVIGNVNWCNTTSDGWSLIFDEGVDEGKILVADESVLLDNDWTIRNQIKSTTVEGVEFNCFNGTAIIYMLDVELYNNPTLGLCIRILNGPTGHESCVVSEIDQEKMIRNGWWACWGTVNNDNKLYISGLQLKQMFKDLLG